MQPHLQPAEVEPLLGRHHDLAVHHDAGRQLVEQHRVQVGEIAIERPQVTTLDEHIVRAAKYDRAKPVPFGLEQEVAAVRNLLGDLSEHGFYGGGNCHAVN